MMFAHVKNTQNKHNLYGLEFKALLNSKYCELLKIHNTFIVSNIETWTDNISWFTYYKT